MTWARLWFRIPKPESSGPQKGHIQRYPNLILNYSPHHSEMGLCSAFFGEELSHLTLKVQLQTHSRTEFAAVVFNSNTLRGYLEH